MKQENHINCIACSKTLENLDYTLRDGKSVEVHPMGGLHFRTYGHYGSTVFDPMGTGEYLDVAICDECVLKNMGNVRGSGQIDLDRHLGHLRHGPVSLSINQPAKDPPMKVTPTTISVSPKEEHPLFGERTTFVSVEDEGAGFFIKVTQHLDSGTHEIRLDVEEFEYIMQAVNILAAGIPND